MAEASRELPWSQRRDTAPVVGGHLIHSCCSASEKMAPTQGDELQMVAAAC